MIDAAKFVDWVARLREGLLADLNGAHPTRGAPRVAFEYVVASQLPLHPVTSQMGGERAYRGRLGMGRCPPQSGRSHSAALRPLDAKR